MSSFAHRGRELACEGVPLAAIARAVGTPVYVYSTASLRQGFEAMRAAFADRDALICYSVKANSNLAVLGLFARLGSGFDIVSGGELYRVLAAGGDPARTVFSGVGKTDEEIDYALSERILLFNVESAEELARLGERARRRRQTARFAIRVNPDVDPRTHPYIATGLRESKFGVPMDEAKRLYLWARKRPGLEPLGVDCHIGSQLTDLRPLEQALGRVAGLMRDLRAQGLPLRTLDVGGGLGVAYARERPPSPAAYARAIARATAGLVGAQLVLEPGRALVADAGILLTKVLYRKRNLAKRFAVVDAGMNDLLRPALYGAHHAIAPVRPRRGPRQRVEVVGPVCESADVLAAGRMLPALEPGDLLGIFSAGAYGMSMASSYNARPRPAEVLVDGRRFEVVRARERYADLVRGERARGAQGR